MYSGWPRILCFLPGECIYRLNNSKKALGIQIILQIVSAGTTKDEPIEQA